MEKTLIIKKNRIKFYIYFVLSTILLFGALAMSIIGSLNPSKYVYWFLPSKEIVFVVSVIGIIFTIMGLILVLYNVFNDKYYIEINNQGVFIGLLPYHNRFVRWEDIEEIEEKKINYNKYLVLFVKDPILYLDNDNNLLHKFFFKMNLNMHGTPYFINTNSLDCSFEELKKNIIEYWKLKRPL